MNSNFETSVIRDGLVWPESPRWHDGKLWVSEAFAEVGTVRSLYKNGSDAKVYPVDGGPAGIGFLSNGCVVVAAAFHRKVLILRPGNNEFEDWVGLDGIAEYPNELIVGQEDRIFVSDSAFLVGRDPYSVGRLVAIDCDGKAQIIAEDLAFPNGLSLSQTGDVLTVAETFAGRITQFNIDNSGHLVSRRSLIEFDNLGIVEDTAAMFARSVVPDGICLDQENHIWVANPLRAEVLRVSPAGEIVDGVSLSQGGIACMLGGEDGRTLFVTTGDATNMASANGRIEVKEVLVQGAGYPLA
ncbi:SMP-30/gluconolactonase/LRE family protein [Ruegeria sp. HU-ET01832]|uniref:SMP-30/gluconolactonase/LRE family protein n=1 Tax=Ruegeria sp. HU-ET01832 TaxID=3135906 RepID=UPI003105EFC0